MPPHVCPDCLAEVADVDSDDCPSCGFVRPPTGWLVDPLTGLILAGRYRLEGRLGAGGMASVFRASRVGALGGKVAVKILAPRLSRTVVARRFEREAQVVSHLSNPHVVRIYDFDTFTFPGSAQPLYFIAMELVEGTNLSQLLRRQGRVNFMWAIDVLRQTARGLDEAHQAGIVHRDLKPSNLMLLQQREATHVKIVDFGIAALGETTGEPVEKLTQTGFVSGTPDYMAPEQAVSTGGAGPPADIYALGVIAFELFSGARPFVGDSIIDVLMQRVTRPAPSLREACGDQELPRDVYRIVDKMLAREPADRYQNAGELLEELARFPALQTRPDFVVPGALGLDETLDEAQAAATLAARPSAGPGDASAPVDAALAPSPTTPAPIERTSTASAIHTHPPDDDAPARPRARWPWWALGALALGGVGVGAWLLTAGPRDAGPEAATSAPVAALTTADATSAEASPDTALTAATPDAPSPAVDDAATAPSAPREPSATEPDANPPPAATVALGHARPPLEPGFVSRTVRAGELSLAFGVPDPLPALYAGLPLRLALDRGDEPLRLARARIVVTLERGDAIGAVEGRGRPQDGRVALDLPALPLAARYRLDVSATLPDGTVHAFSAIYDAATGALTEAAPR